MSRAKSADRIRANDYAFAADFQLAMLKSLREGKTVTRFSLEPRDESLQPIEFELVVTKFNGTRLPRVSKS